MGETAMAFIGRTEVPPEHPFSQPQIGFGQMRPRSSAPPSKPAPDAVSATPSGTGPKLLEPPSNLDDAPKR
jgi:hypothetical protein